MKGLGGRGWTGGERKREGEGGERESGSVSEPKSHTEIAFSFILRPGKGPIKQALIGDRSVVATGSLVSVSWSMQEVGATLSIRNVCVLRHP